MFEGDKTIINFKKLGSGTVIAINIVGLTLVILTAGLLSTTKTVPSSGTISAINLGVYSDSGCTSPLSPLNFGMVTPGTQVT